MNEQSIDITLSQPKREIKIFIPDDNNFVLTMETRMSSQKRAQETPTFLGNNDTS